jgi:hypothetical protein
MTWKLPALFFGALLMVQCGSGNGGDSDAKPPADTVSADSKKDDSKDTNKPDIEPICTPDDLNGCSGDFKAEIVCNDDGSGWETRPCKGENGFSTICHSSEGCLMCIPGKKRCLDDENLEMCNEDGTGWIEDANCNGEVTGQVCTQSQQGASCVRLCELSLKWNTYMGCEYWGVDLDNAFVSGGKTGYLDAAGAQFAIVVSNPSDKLSATITVTDSDGPVLYDANGDELSTEKLGPGELRVLNLPRRDVNSTILAALAYKVEASIPITVYQFNPLENEDVYSNDASLLLPVNVFGKWYIVMSREQTFEMLRSYVTVVASHPDTTSVTITVTAPTLPDDGIPHLEPGESVTVEMHQYDVLNIETNKPGSDPTGTVVYATRPVAVFGGSEAANAPNTAHCDIEPGEEEGVCQYDGVKPCDSPLDCLEYNTCCADHLEQQMFPVKTWGKHYIASQSFQRGAEKDIWRIIAAEKNTQITTVPPQAVIPVLDSGEWFEFESDNDFEIVATKPILVGQFLAAEQAPEPNVNGIPQPGDAGTGDPAFILAVPFEQYRKDYVFLAPDKYAFDYVNIVAPTGSVVRFDGQELSPSEFDPIGTGQFSVTRILIDDGVHAVDSDEKIGIIVYGYDQYVSYGYPGGLDLKDLGFIKESAGQ